MLHLLCRTYFGASEPVSALAQRPGLAVLRVNLSFHLYFRPALVCAHAPLSGVFALQCVLVHVMEEEEGFAGWVSLVSWGETLNPTIAKSW